MASDGAAPDDVLMPELKLGPTNDGMKDASYVGPSF
jgi:hypothetical protein